LLAAVVYQKGRFSRDGRRDRVSISKPAKTSLKRSSYEIPKGATDKLPRIGLAQKLGLG
jgi:hypothetical protein